MIASLLTNLVALKFIIGSPAALLISAFQIWMLVDAIRQREWVWALFILVGWGFASLWYYFSVYRGSASSMRGFEFPGAQSRRRIKELQAQIHHLDKAHHYYQLGDVYFQRGKLDQAEVAYRAALERDPEDLDTRAHLGQCLLREKRAAEARPLLEQVAAQNPKHEYSYTMMALAEALTALGEKEKALEAWKQVTALHYYPRAKVQLAELLITLNQTDRARTELNEVLSDDAHAPAFQRKRDRFWVRRARGVLKKLG
jgi:tetratricopeptide (TPR) repeat protein